MALTVFISHSFDNRPEFENVAEWLDKDGVPYWQPAEIRSGESLRDQLRAAVNACSVCIFIATHRSVASSWCGAELGAFWGARIPIIVYLADSSLPEESLPPILQGDVWERRMSRIAARAKELVNVAKAGGSGSPPPSASVSSMTVEQLERLILGAVSLVEVRNSDNAKTGLVERDLESVAHAAAGRVLRGVEATRRLGADAPGQAWRRTILWVDDRPANNVRERRALESFGVEFTLAQSTDEALGILAGRQFAAVISDMGRREGPREGYKLLEAVRKDGNSTPYFFYTGSAAPEHRREARARGAQGATSVATELIDMVLGVLEGSPGT